MHRHLLSLVLAATVALVAALVVASQTAPLAARADEQPAPPVLATSPTPTAVAPGNATPLGARRARIVVPRRDLQVAEAPPLPAPSSDDDTRPAPRRLSGTGTLVAAAGTSRDEVDRGGRTVRFSVEVEQDTGLDPDAVAAVVEEALYDQRSWARDHELRRVAPSEAALHVVIATPASVDALCARAGLNTAGWLSCWNGSVAAINLDRWMVGVDHVEDLALYRRYVVNHEVGHGLGHGHVDCPGGGRAAPVMQQQTKSLDGCRANEWPYPSA